MFGLHYKIYGTQNQVACILVVILVHSFGAIL